MPDIIDPYIVYGTDGADSITPGGTTDGVVGIPDDAANLIYGYDGADTIRAGGGVDTINGGNGRDRLEGGNGNDVVSAEFGRDTIQGDGGDDVLFGGGDNDIIYGDLFDVAGDGYINGGTENDTLYGGSGNDDLDGSLGNDRVYGDAGNDTVTGSAGDDTVNGGDGNDSLRGSDGADTVHGGEGRNTLRGGDGADSLTGGDDDDTMRGDSGNDRLYGQYVGEYMVGIAARTGAWMDRLRVACAAMRQGLAWGPRHFPENSRGGRGGSPVEAYCGDGEVLVSMKAFTVDQPKAVSDIHFICRSIATGKPRRLYIESTAVNPHGRGLQQCPDGEIAVGLHGRYGIHVNAVGLICGPFTAPSPPVTPVSPATGLFTTWETRTNRPGSDYADFVVADAPECRAVCGAQPQCQAWAFSSPGVYGPQPHCWLKSAVPPLVADDRFASGVRKGLAETATNRPGIDYADFDIVARPEICRDKCAQQAQCKSWVYARTGVHGPFAHCWLKNGVPWAVPDPNFSAGVK